MAAFQSITPRQALQLVEGASIPNSHRIIIDYAGAGIVKAYALMSEVVHPTGEKTVTRDGTIAAGLWKRIQGEGHSDDVWLGGTLRLGADPSKGLAEVHLTGVSFNQASLQRLIKHQRGGVAVTPVPAATAKKPEKVAADVAPTPPRPGPSAIPPGALFVTVRQAMAALGLGRTKVNEMMNDGRLTRRKVDRSTLIEVESILRLARRSTTEKE